MKHEWIECCTFIIGSSTCLECCIDSGYRSLSSSFFISCCSVYLSCHEQILDDLGFKRMAKLRGIEEIVFNRIARTVDFQVLESGHLF